MYIKKANWNSRCVCKRSPLTFLSWSKVLDLLCQGCVFFFSLQRRFLLRKWRSPHTAWGNELLFLPLLNWSAEKRRDNTLTRVKDGHCHRCSQELLGLGKALFVNEGAALVTVPSDARPYELSEYVLVHVLDQWDVCSGRFMVLSHFYCLFKQRGIATVRANVIYCFFSLYVEALTLSPYEVLESNF